MARAGRTPDHQNNERIIMLINDFLPDPSLRGFVQCYRIVHFEFDNTDPIPFKAYPPKPEQCLHFFLRDAFAIEKDSKKIIQPPVLFSGQQTSLVKQYNGSDFIDVQVVFQPTALFRLSGLPAHELTNHFFDATDIFSKDIKFTLEQLQQAAGYDQMLAIAENFVKGLIRQAKKGSHQLDLISQQMKQNAGNTSMDMLASHSCLCTKQFKRKFFERTGVNPKTYSRIIRFNKAFNLRNWLSDKDWSHIAFKCGYTDYQHLSKDYKDFTGLTPYEFHHLEDHSPENVLRLTGSLYRTRALV
jgi:AraC-like DNA-binding protein